jgi:hypothetical protein
MTSLDFQNFVFAIGVKCGPVEGIGLGVAPVEECGTFEVDLL